MFHRKGYIDLDTKSAFGTAEVKKCTADKVSEVVNENIHRCDKIIIEVVK